LITASLYCASVSFAILSDIALAASRFAPRTLESAAAVGAFVLGSEIMIAPSGIALDSGSDEG
jgi:hypothetical protein